MLSCQQSLVVGWVCGDPTPGKHWMTLRRNRYSVLFCFKSTSAWQRPEVLERSVHGFREARRRGAKRRFAPAPARRPRGPRNNPRRELECDCRASPADEQGANAKHPTSLLPQPINFFRILRMNAPHTEHSERTEKYTYRSKKSLSQGSSPIGTVSL